MSCSASPEHSAFVAHALCPPHLCKLVEDTVEAFDSAQLLPPQQGELFESAKDCLRRLQGYALSCGFAVVTTTSKKGRAQFAYIYYKAETKNYYNLKVYINRDKNNNIINKRKRKQKIINIKYYI